MATPVTVGLRLGIGAAPPSGAALAIAGERVPVQITAGPTTLRGEAVPGDTGVAVEGGLAVLLAGELHSGPGGAQLLLQTWQRYGPAALRLLQGRFAAVVLDGDRLTLATDHAGSVPLYVRAVEGGLQVATEAKAFAAGRSAALPGTAPVPGPAGVLRVRAGTAVTVPLGGGPAAAIRTWRPPEHREALPPDQAVTRVREALEAAVSSRIGDGDVTVVLSGGIDSSAVAALARRHARGTVTTVSLGTDAGDEFDAARLVADHLGTRHEELRVRSEDVVGALAWAVAATEIVDADVLEYLLPLVVLHRALPAGPRRVLTGYGADIPLGGMHRTERSLAPLDAVIAEDMATFDGLNEMSPVIGAVAGHWTTHPYWDRTLLDLLVRLDPGLKRREGIDKWVLRRAVADLLPEKTVRRPKLGIHEGSGTTSTWTAMLRAEGLPAELVAAAKGAMATAIHARVVGLGESPEGLDVGEVLRGTVAGKRLVAR